MMPTGIPPGFRFHPTEEELLFYYLRKKVLYEAIDLDVIREIDLNKLEPWDLKDKCRIGTDEHQNEWYFFSHKDKKYPTGTRTNRATTAGFWKATGRDKSVHVANTSRAIGMRKTLVFYTGRAPHGHKTDWIMHEYRLNTDYNDRGQVLGQENGWVVCRVFTKKNHSIRPNFQEKAKEAGASVYMKPSTKYHRHHHQRAALYDFGKVDNSMHLPLLLYSQDQSPYYTLSNMDTTTLCFQQERLNNNEDWLFLDKLLASNTNMQDYDQFTQKQMAL